MYIGNKEVLKFEEVYIYGTGDDAEIFYNRYNSIVNILGFIDTYNYNKIFHGIQVFSPQKCIDTDVKGKILIASSRCCNEISMGLQALDLRAGEDYYIWDVFDDYIVDESTQRIIDLFNTKWGCSDGYESHKRILIPFDNLHDSYVIMYAYVGNYLCNKYYAVIDCFIREGKKISKENLRKVYASFGVSGFLEGDISEQQQKRAVLLHNEIWDEIEDYEDWKNITVYGIRFGTTIIRNYLRWHELLLDCKDIRLKDYLLECMKTIVYWYDRLEAYDYKTIILCDGAHWEGFIRDIAITKDIPTYMMNPYSKCRKLYLNDAWCGYHYKYYGDFWNQLSYTEKKLGLEWAKGKLKERIEGKDEAVNYFGERSPFLLEPDKNPFLSNSNDEVIISNKKVKIMICAHWFDDDPYMYGSQIFDDNYISWLCHIGELSSDLNQYDWYLKMHPLHGKRDDDFFDAFLDKYKNIKKLPDNISPIQLKEQGIEWALTVQGSIGEEYPMIGIQVVNAGANSHVAFDYNWNPRTKQEYDDIIHRLETLHKKEDISELYKFYCIDHLYYDYSIRTPGWNFKNPDLNKDDFWFEIEGDSKRQGTWKYDLFMQEYDDSYDDKQFEFIETLFDTMDSYNEKIFYKNDPERIRKKLLEVGINPEEYCR